MRIEETRIKQSLKSLMKKQGLQFRDLARLLGVSVPTVKRWLNGSELSLSRLSEISECLGVSVYDLIEQSKSDESPVYCFTEKQETVLAGDLSCLMILRWVMMKKPFKEILRECGLTEISLRRKLRLLEESDLIRRMPNDRLASRVTFPVKWLEDGPLQRAYFSRNIAFLFERIRNSVTRPVYDPASGMFCRPFEIFLSKGHLRDFGREMMELYSKYVAVSQQDLRKRPEDGELVSGMIFADAFSIWLDPSERRRMETPDRRPDRNRVTGT